MAGACRAFWAGRRPVPRPLCWSQVVEKPETMATAIRIGNPARWRQALEALDESGGIITAVSDEKILESWKLLAKLEGVFVEPASATGSPL
jgi:threonine synthase